MVHAIANAKTEDLHNDFIYTSKEGFSHALDVSSYSFVLAARIAKEIDLLNENASLVTLTYYGSTKVLNGYNVMGVAKAALESSVRYLAENLGKRRKKSKCNFCRSNKNTFCKRNKRLFFNFNGCRRKSTIT